MFLVPSTAFVAALLFAVHPIHTEAVGLSPPLSDCILKKIASIILD